MACKCGPACIALRSSLNRAFPGRSIVSDGCCASATHTSQNPRSDHEPDASGYAAAYDITHDPATGVDCGRLAPRLQRDPRVNYLIWNRAIWSRARADEGWRTYSGSNPHTSHLHVSVFRSMVMDDRPWQVLDTADPPQPDDEEDDMALRTYQENGTGPEIVFIPGRGAHQLNADEKRFLVQLGLIKDGPPLPLAPNDARRWFGDPVPSQ